MGRGSIASALTSTIGKFTPGKKSKKKKTRRHRRNYSSSSSSSSVDYESDSISSVSGSLSNESSLSSASHSSCSETYEYSYDRSPHVIHHKQQQQQHRHRKEYKKHHRRNHHRKRRKRRYPRRNSHYIDHNLDNDDDDSDRMIDLLMRIIPFYGQGDKGSDNVVIDTIQRLPPRALEVRDDDGNTLVMIACQAGAFGLLPILLSKGCDVNARNNVGASCLHYACFADTFSPNAAMTLVRHGAVAEVVEKEYGCTPLHWAAYHGHVELCRVLCGAGANPSTIDKNGCDPISYSRESGKVACTQLLESCRAGVDFGGDDDCNTSIPIQEEKLDWIRCMDGNMNSFYHNKETGESLWGDDFRSNIVDKEEKIDDVGVDNDEAKKEQMSTLVKAVVDDVETKNDDGNGVDLVPSSNKSSLEKNDNTKRRPTLTRLNSWDDEWDEVKRKSEPTKKQCPPTVVENETSALEATTTTSATPTQNGSSATDNAIASNKFEDRLSILHEKLNNRLESLEEKMIRQKKEEEQTEDKGAISVLQNDLATMTTTNLDLKTQIGQKDLDILSLKQQIVVLETKICAKPRTFDVGIGVEISSKEEHDEELAAANVESKRQLNEAQNKIDQLQSEMDKLSQELNDATTKYEEMEESLHIAKKTALDEKASRESLMQLLQQAKEGQEVDSELTQSLQDERDRAETTMSELKEELRVLKAEFNAKESTIRDELLVRKAEIDRLKNDITQTTASHAVEITALKEKHQKEKEVSIDNLIQHHKAELKHISDQLREETLSKMEMEASKYEAIAALETAQEKARTATAKLNEMTDLIKLSKHLEKNNEELNLSLQKETERRKVLHNTIEDMKGRIRVYVRIRPLSETEKHSNCANVMTKEDDRTISMAADPSTGAEAKAWEFDKIFCGTGEEGNTQEAVFKDTSLLITSAIDGFNVCIFAYGQTGSGKTYTMFGGSETNDESQKGLATRVASELFSKLRERNASCDVEVAVSMLELYNDRLRDLLLISNHNDSDSVIEPTLKIRLAEHTTSGLVEVDGLTMDQVSDVSGLLDIFNRGVNNRTSASTKMNADSSRSHMVASIVVSLRNRRSGHIVRGKLTLVDLAGSERVSKSGATGEQLKEAQSINKSLSALGDVIGALTSGSQHVPYRNNPLTMLMSDSIGGNAKSLMFVCCSPSDYNQRESQQSLDFAKRCRNVRNNAQRSSTGQLKALRAELSKIKAKEKGGNGVKRRPMGGMRRPGM